MKKFLLAIGVAALVFTMVSCGDLEVDSVGIDVERPGAPSNVTVSLSGDDNWALVSWRAGGNTVHGGFEIVARPQGSNHPFVIADEAGGTVSPTLFVTNYNMPWANAGINLEEGNTVRFTWRDEGATLTWVVNDNLEYYQAIVSLALVNRNPIANLELGVRAVDRFQDNWAHDGQSSVTWASGTFPATRRVNSIVNTPNVTGELVVHSTIGANINLNEISFDISPDAATNRSIRWNITTPEGFHVPHVNGVFTLPHGGTFSAVGAIINPNGAVITRTVQISIPGTQFVPVTSIQAPTRTDNAIAVPTGTGVVTPNNATVSNIDWEFRQRMAPDPATGVTARWSDWATFNGATIPVNGRIEVRATIAGGRSWTDVRDNAHIPGAGATGADRSPDFRPSVWGFDWN